MNNVSQKIILAYSTKHFNPKTGLIKGSAGEIASACYQAITDIFGSEGVIYVDSDMPETWPQDPGKISALITRDSNVALQVSHFKPDKVLLIAVNQHIKVRNSLAEVAGKLGLPKQALDASDGVFELTSGVRLADKVIIVGDGSTRNTYINNGVSSKDILPVAYAQKTINFSYTASDDTDTLLVHLGSLGFRKGLDKILIFLESEEFKQSSLKLVVTGNPVNQYWKDRIRAACNDERVSFPGWLDVHSDSFNQILRKTRLAIFPSREEGLSGAYLEIARTGIPVLTTRNVGIETLSELTLNDDSYLEFMVALRRLLASGVKELESLSNNQIRYLSLIPNDGEQLKGAVTRFLQTGRIWPRVDLKLCVHDKGSTIFELITSWDKSAEGIDNCGITVINDGSRDNSQHEIERAKSSCHNLDRFDIFWADDIFEVRSNNMALKNGVYDFAVIIQDDNFCVDIDLLPELTATADKFRRIGIIGGLAGVNFFPINPECECNFTGQHISTQTEHYQRIDHAYDPSLKTAFFQVDAVMRGPLIISAEALADVGFLDERYAPLYNDDMAWCYQAAAKGWGVFALLGGVINNSESMSGGSEAQKIIYTAAFEKNAKLFYSEWEHSESKNYLRLNRNWLNRQEIKSNHQLLVKFYLKAAPNKLRLYILVKFPHFGKILRRIKHLILRSQSS
jgi:GT2 family glycosyltransferase